MNSDWCLEQNPAGLGMVRHHAQPRFTASWMSGDADLAEIEGPCWTYEGSGNGEDSLHVFGFQWFDKPPDQGTFEKLMHEASSVIDAWIAGRM
jgi:hypothetical protein